MSIDSMRSRNQTQISEFILLGFGDLQESKVVLFLLFLLIYLLTITGNVLIVLLVVYEKHLHTPMYFFLGNLSCLETCSSSTLLPRILASFMSGNWSISVNSCFVQHYFVGTFLAVECYLLSVMSYDRYLAICRPLYYSTWMNGRLCLVLVLVSWLNGFLPTTLSIAIISKMDFCGPNEIDHFFCDSFPILELSCSNTHVIKLVIYIVASVFTFPPFMFTLISYVLIIRAILRIASATGKQKAFSTCSSHLIVVTLFYGSVAIVYGLPHKGRLKDLNKVFSVAYTMLTPLVNPLIYSLRNKEVKKSIMCLLFSRIQT
ncbi:olfactory receptor 2AP1-like [Tiliqua scincoides]|uniref:olfactory receptor 2AP1-like n=1 Tax=Tiliqua scincoides TaxID=71010 RepID=UPI003461CCF1